MYKSGLPLGRTGYGHERHGCSIPFDFVEVCVEHVCVVPVLVVIGIRNVPDIDLLWEFP